MIVVDAQVHIWKPETPERPYIKEDASKPHRAIPLIYDNLLQEMTRRRSRSRDLGSAVLGRLSQRLCAGSCAEVSGYRFAVMGKVPLNDPASKDRIASWLKQPGMLGFRISFRHSGTHSFLDDGTADWFWADCERYDIPVMVFSPFAVEKSARSPSAMRACA